MNNSTKRFIFLNVLLAVSLVVIVFHEYNFYKYSLPGIGLFFLLNLLANFLYINNPVLGKVTINSSIEYASTILFGPFISILLSIISFTIHFFAKEYSKPSDLYKLIFNLSLFTSTIACVSIVYVTFGGVIGNVQNSSLLSLLVAGIVYYTVNVSILTFLFTILKQTTYITNFKSNLKWAIPNFIALTPLGYLIAFTYSVASLAGVTLFIIPLLLARHAIKLYMEMREMYLDTISSLAATIDAKDEYTLGHSDRVSQYAVAIARQMMISEEEIEKIKYIALLHDIGKIAVPEMILNKPSKLSDSEFEIMKYHVEYGENIVKKIRFLQGHEAIRAHHERFDGKGYPDKLQGKNIPLVARIMAVADSFDAMTSDRPYRKAMTHEEAFEELIKCKDTQFDPTIVDAFIQIHPSIEIAIPEQEVLLLPQELRDKFLDTRRDINNAL